MTTNRKISSIPVTLPLFKYMKLIENSFPFLLFYLAEKNLKNKRKPTTLSLFIP